MTKNKRGFLKNLTLPKSARTELFQRLDLKKLPNQSLKFLGHLFANLSKKYFQDLIIRKAYLIPVPSYVRYQLDGQQGAQEKYIKLLRDEELITIWPYDKNQHLCYRYEISRELAELFLDVMVRHTKSSNQSNSPLVYFHNGKQVPTQKFKASPLHDNNGNQLPTLQKKAIQACEGIRCLNLELFYEILIPERDELKEQLENGKESVRDELTKILHDLWQVSKIVNRCKSHYSYQDLYYEGELRRFKILNWHVRFDSNSPYGRLYDEHSLYLNISGRGKSLLRFCKQNEELQFNYDIVACYPHILKGLAEYYNRPINLLKQDIKKQRKRIANQANLPEKAVKKCINSVTFNAQVISYKSAYREFKNIQNQKQKKPNYAIIEPIWETVNNASEFWKAYQVIYKWLKPYSQQVRNVISCYLNDPNNQSHGQNGKCLKNAVGRCIDVPKEHNEQFLKQAQTHILQGIEGCFIQTLAAIQENYEYRVQYIEHDGAVITGKIPEEAKEKARQAANFPYAELESKDNELQKEHLNELNKETPERSVSTTSKVQLEEIEEMLPAA